MAKTPDIRGLVEKLNRPSTTAKKVGGFFDLPAQKSCNHPEHPFPSHLYIQPGKGYTHVCPGCGSTQTVTNPIVN